MSSALAAQLREVRFVVVTGRIQAGTEQLGGSVTSSTRQADREERLTVNLMSGVPTIDYHLTTPDVQVSLELREGNQLSIKRITKSDAGDEELAFTQPADGALTLVVGQEPDARTWTAPTLWHLLLEEPELGRQQLVPLIELLRPGWQLRETADAIEQSLTRTPSARRTAQREHWSSLVAQLADDDFSVRQAAQRDLQNAGPAVISYLRSLDPDRLDAEQRSRIRRVIAALSGTDAEDTPRRAMTWLATDPLVWIALLGRDDPEVRRVALDQLEAVTGEAIDFDTDADVEHRQQQREALKARFGERVQTMP